MCINLSSSIVAEQQSTVSHDGTRRTTSKLRNGRCIRARPIMGSLEQLGCLPQAMRNAVIAVNATQAKGRRLLTE